MASALAGELESHASPFYLLKASLRGMEMTARQKKPLPLYGMLMPTGPVFDSAPAKAGVLGPELAGECTYAYEQLRAFRNGIQVVAENHEKMDPDQVANRLLYLLQVIETNEQRLSALIHGLYAYSRVRFVETPSMESRRVVRRPFLRQR